MLSKRVLVSSLALSVAFACTEAQDDSDHSSNSNTDEGGKNGAGQGGVAGKLTSAGTTSVSQGATSSSAGAGTSGNGGGGKNGSGGASGGRAGSGSGGANGGSSVGTSSAGTGMGGTSSAGTGSTGFACVEEPAPDPGAGGADAGGTGAGGEAGAAAAAAGANGAGGAPAMGGAPGAPDLFFDDFELGSSKWTTTLGTWALVADGSQAFGQSAQENKLQIAVANRVCAADQVIDAKIKVVAFKGQSNSYMAALFGRALSPTTHYLLALGSDGKLALRKRINSTSTGATAIGSAVTTTITAGQWYDVHFELIGTSLKGCIGAVCVTGTDSSIASGSVGVGTVNTSARFDDVRLTTP